MLMILFNLFLTFGVIHGVCRVTGAPLGLVWSSGTSSRTEREFHMVETHIEAGFAFV